MGSTRQWLSVISSTKQTDVISGVLWQSCLAFSFFLVVKLLFVYNFVEQVALQFTNYPYSFVLPCWFEYSLIRKSLLYLMEKWIICIWWRGFSAALDKPFHVFWSALQAVDSNTSCIAYSVGVPPCNLQPYLFWRHRTPIPAFEPSAFPWIRLDLHARAPPYIDVICPVLHGIHGARGHSAFLQFPASWPKGVVGNLSLSLLLHWMLPGGFVRKVLYWQF